MQCSTRASRFAGQAGPGKRFATTSGNPVPRALIGSTLRECRRALGMTQARLAAEAGISASYLNLIESNKRNIGGSLLKRIADILGVPLDELDGAAERRLADDLGALAGEPLLADLHLDPDDTSELASRHRGWAHALVRLQRAWHDRGRAVSALSDRLNQDPFLGGAVHSMLTQAAAIRSSAEILMYIDDLEPAQRQRFLAIVSDESVRLGQAAQSLAAFFDGAQTGTRSMTPVDEIDDFIIDRDNHFPELEETATDFRAAVGIVDDCRESALARYLHDTHGITVVTRPTAGSTATGPRHRASFDAESRTFTIPESAPRSTRRFELARLAVQQFRQGRAIDAALMQATQLSSDAARHRARRVLSSYLAAAVLMPYGPFLEAAQKSRYDIDYLAQRFGASFEQICHRLVALHRPGAAGIPFGLMRIDAAGFTSKRFPLPQLAVPRHGPACPMWAIYQAFLVPGTVVRQLVEFPAGDRLLFIARIVEKPRPAFTAPRRVVSLMLVCDALYADQTVYGDGLDLSSSAPVVPVGPGCRLCVRRDCLYREEDPIINA